MLLFILAMALTDAQQAQHDNTEWAIYQRIKADEAAISEIWHPNAKLLLDYRKARGCYVRLHVYRVADCDVELAQVDRDLGNVDVARADGR
jgi:hypothetical protein